MIKKHLNVNKWMDKIDKRTRENNIFQAFFPQDFIVCEK